MKTIMKKIYVAPMTETVSVGQTEMICASIEVEGTTQQGGINSADSRMFNEFPFIDED
jgi:hypothetical protein